MRHRSSTALLKRLERVEKKTRGVKPVVLRPELLDAQAWGAVATVAQERLKLHVKSDEPGRCDYSDLLNVRILSNA